MRVGGETTKTKKKHFDTVSSLQGVSTRLNSSEGFVLVRSGLLRLSSSTKEQSHDGAGHDCEDAGAGHKSSVARGFGCSRRAVLQAKLGCELARTGSELPPVGGKLA